MTETSPPQYVKVGQYISWLNRNGVSCAFGVGRTKQGAKFETFKLSKDGLEFVLTGESQHERMHPLQVMQCDRLFGLTSPWGSPY